MAKPSVEKESEAVQFCLNPQKRIPGETALGKSSDGVQMFRVNGIGLGEFVKVLICNLFNRDLRKPFNDRLKRRLAGNIPENKGQFGAVFPQDALGNLNLRTASKVLHEAEAVTGSEMPCRAQILDQLGIV